MSDHSEPTGGRDGPPGREPKDRPHASDQRDELRTIAFRLREIQRLLGARVEQENRRMAADGVEPVTDRDFFHPDTTGERTRGRPSEDE